MESSHAKTSALRGDKNRDLRRNTKDLVFLTFCQALLLILLAYGPTAFASSGTTTSDSQLTIPRLPEAPTLSAFLRMAPASDVARQMARVEVFTQREPHDGESASQRTEAYLGYDEKHFFVVFVCSDSDPKGIHAHLNRRENIDQEDIVQIYLDTFLDHRRAYNFAANALGVQRDAIWTETQEQPDYSFDTVWDSRAARTDTGYVVWIAIPFKSLRFPPSTEQRWGIVLQRSIPRASEESFWPRVSRNVQGFLTQEGELTGLSGISPGRNIQLNSYAVGQSFQQLDLREPANPHRDGKHFGGTGGLDAKAVVKDRFVLDATFNPDFSQVESDEPQLTANQRFAVFFPEKRPFFLENSDFFDGPAFAGRELGFYNPTVQYVFTRNIQNPEYGVRLSGRQGPYSIGVLVADDRGPGQTVANTDPEFRKRAYFAISRIRRDFGEKVSVGAFYTGREFDGGFNRVGGLDARIKLGEKWVASLGAAASATRGTDSMYRSGTAYDARLEYADIHWQNGIEYHDVELGFQTDTGFFRRPDIRRVLGGLNYNFRPESGKILAWGPSFTAGQSYDHKNDHLDDIWDLSGHIDLPSQTTVRFGYGWLRETLRPQDFSTLLRNRDYHEPYNFISFRTTPLRQLSFDAFISPGATINYNPPKGLAPLLADEILMNASMTIRPFTSLVVDSTYLLDRLRDHLANVSMFTNHIIRSKWNYQFTRELSFRLILQYSAILPNPSFTSLERTKNLNTDFLITYLIHPSTAFYLGYNSNFENIDPALCRRLPSGFCDPEGPGLLLRSGPLKNDGRTLFIKLSYNFRY